MDVSMRALQLLLAIYSQVALIAITQSHTINILWLIGAVACDDLASCAIQTFLRQLVLRCERRCVDIRLLLRKGTAGGVVHTYLASFIMFLGRIRTDIATYLAPS